MIIVAGTLRVDPLKRAALETAFDQMRTATLQEAGCLEYQVWHDRQDPGLLLLLEKWQDDAALQSHFQAPHMAQFAVAVAEIGILGRELSKYVIASATSM